jgi:hypothetical protein
LAGRKMRSPIGHTESKRITPQHELPPAKIVLDQLLVIRFPEE